MVDNDEIIGVPVPLLLLENIALLLTLFQLQHLLYSTLFLVYPRTVVRDTAVSLITFQDCSSLRYGIVFLVTQRVLADVYPPSQQLPTDSK